MFKFAVDEEGNPAERAGPRVRTSWQLELLTGRLRCSGCAVRPGSSL